MKKTLTLFLAFVLLCSNFIGIRVSALSEEDFEVIWLEEGLSFGFGYRGDGDFSEGLASVNKDYKCGYIDKTGKVVIPIEYDKISDFVDGVAIVYKDEKKGVLINKNYKPVENNTPVEEKMQI